MKLSVAIAGAGMVTRHHLIAWSKAARAEVVAIQNRTLEKARKRASEFGIPKVYSDLEEMLDKEKPDALDVAVSVEAHSEFVRKAAACGVHILCQKPMATTLQEAESLVSDIGDRVRFMIHENWRFRPQYRQTRTWITEGSVGSVREFQLLARSSGMVSPEPKARPPALERQPFLADLPRLVIFELLIHHLDVIRYLLGPIAVKGCWTQRISPHVTGEDFGLIFLASESGAAGTVSGNMSAPGYPPRPQDRLELIGDRASILFEGDTLKRMGDRSETLRYDLESAYQQSYDNAISHFTEALLKDMPFETDRLDNLETLRLVEAAYAMAQQRQG